MAICYLCKGKEVVQIKDDKIARLWPCPSCRIEEFHVVFKISKLDAEQFVGDKQERIAYMKHHVKHRLVNDLVDAVSDAREQIDSNTGEITYEIELWVVLPRIKGP